MFQLSLHHDLWTIELPEKRENCRCRGRANKAGIITGNVETGKASAPRWTRLLIVPAIPRSSFPLQDEQDLGQAHLRARGRSVARRCAGVGVLEIQCSIADL